MTGLVTIVSLVLALVMVLLSVIASWRERMTSTAELILAGATEVALLVYVVVRVIDLARGHRTEGVVIVVAYLVGLLLILPITAALAIAERSRWGPAILASGGLVVCVMFARINQLWNPHG